MKISKSKNGEKIIIELDFFQNKNNPYDKNEEKELTHNLIGVIAGEELTISQLNDLSYKDSQQEGQPLIHFYGNKTEFVRLCKKLAIAIWEHELCVCCKKPVYGACSLGDKGVKCFDCEQKEEACTSGANEKEELDK